MSKKSESPKVAAAAKQKVSEEKSKMSTFWVRTIYTLLMLAGFLTITLSGHVYIIALVGLIEVLCFRELIALSSQPVKERSLPYSKALSYYSLAVSLFYLEGTNVLTFLRALQTNNSIYWLPLETHHRFISFSLYIIGFTFFVTSLKKGYYKFQLAQFCITHMALLLVVGQAHFIVNNIFAGLFWFFVPAALVITNDIFAYLCGITFGRTQLIAISPKKTKEGFIGAWILTVIMGIILSVTLARFKYVICPAKEVGANVFSGMNCQPNPVFVNQVFPVPPAIQPWVHKETVSFKPVHLHVICLATFASLVAPFGGFFCSGVKRAFEIKDFGDTIPGHGGIVDRMDCQFLMGVFSYLYYESFVSTHNLSMSSVLQTAITSLSPQDQRDLVEALLRYLVNQNMVSAEVLECVVKF